LNIFAIVLVAEKVTVVSSVSMHQLETSETVEISKNICGNDRLNFLLWKNATKILGKILTIPRLLAL